MKYIVALALLLAVASAAAPLCPNSTDAKPIYTQNSFACPRAEFCYTEFCSCLGGSWSNATNSCPALNPSTSCGALQTCSKKAIRCFDEQAEIAVANKECLDWASPIHSALLVSVVDTPAEFVNTTAYAACQSATCEWASVANCPTNYKATCVRVPQYFGTLRLSGNWAKAINTTNKKQDIKNSLEIDLTNELLTEVSVADVRLGSLIVDFTIEDMNDNTDARIEKAAQSNGWLTNTTSTFHKNGGEGDVEVSYIGSTVPVTSAPDTTVSPNTPAPGKSDDKKKCGTGCVVGIVIGVIVFVVLVGAVVAMRGKKTESHEEDELTTHEGGSKYASTHA